LADPIDGAIGELALTALGARRQPAARGEFLSHLVDTQVLSERRRKPPQPEVVAWLAHRPRQTLYLSVLTAGEIRNGIERPDAARQQPLLDWLEVALPKDFMGRLLAVDAQTVDRWGRLLGSAGWPLPAVDSLLAATALQHNLTLGTRNTADFEGPGVRLINPWMAHNAPGNSTQRKQLGSDPRPCSCHPCKREA
jgi:predicted nucleic acid-binding protein